MYHSTHRSIASAEDNARGLLAGTLVGGRALVQSDTLPIVTDVLHIVQLSHTLQGTFTCREDAKEASAIAREARQYRAAVNGA